MPLVIKFFLKFEKSLITKKSIWLLAIAAVLFLGFFWIIQIRNAPLLYDDSVMASVAKNLSSGYGYATSYHQFRSFDNIITTGFTAILPAALGIKIFGNQYWVPHLTTTALNMILVLSVFYILRRNFNRKLNFGLLILCFSITAFWVIDEVSHSGEYRYFKPWYSLLGEIPGFLFTAIGYAMLLQHRSENRLLAFFAGQTLGFAILTKFIYILPIFCTVVYLIFYRIRKKQLSLTSLTYWLAGIIFPVLVFAVIKSLKETPGDSYASFVAGNASGIKEFLNAPAKLQHLKVNFLRNFLILMKFTGGWIGFVILSVIFLICLFRNLRNRDSLNHLSLIFTISGASIICWYLCLHPYGWIRHVMPGILLVWFGLLISLADLKLTGQVTLSTLLILGIFFTRYDILHKIREGMHKDARTTPMLNVAMKLQSLKAKDSIFLGCAWWANRDMEYLISDSLHFFECEKLIRTGLSGEHKRYFLVRNEAFWNWENSILQKQIAQKCDQQMLLSQKPYTVSECKESDLLNLRALIKSGQPGS